MALLLGLSPFLVAELSLRFSGWQVEIPRDPFVGFDGLQPLFVSSENGESRTINPAKRKFFAAQSFPATKTANEFRIFCLGGSTVQGRPYSAETSLTAWLELSLNAAGHQREYRVINCGGISYASYRLVPILDEVLQLEPDLIIVCTGQNEFLEARSYDHLRDLSSARIQVHRTLGNLRIFQWAEQRIRKPLATPKTALPREVSALLDYKGGLEKYQRDDRFTTAVQKHFAFNIESLIERCDRHSTPLLFLLPVSNLIDCPPFKSEHSADISLKQIADFEANWDASLRVSAAPLERLQTMRSAVTLSPRHAAAHFRLAKLLEGLGRHTEAKEHFRRARDEDVCPLRMLGDMYPLAEEVLRRRATPYLDLRKVIEDAANGQLPSDQWMVDHVHPTVRGHQQIAAEIHEQLIDLQWITPSAADHAEKRDAAFRRHLGNLSEAYFADGKAKLEGLRLWTQGRVKKIHPDL
jgi:hypothetical protein